MFKSTSKYILLVKRHNSMDQWMCPDHFNNQWKSQNDKYIINAVTVKSEVTIIKLE